jgi:hypothetical protein
MNASVTDISNPAHSLRPNVAPPKPRAVVFRSAGVSRALLVLELARISSLLRTLRYD